ncbi:MAG: hypothetical protein ACKVIM_02805 [Flavobacteriales bacterium]|jgi:hypothetical protein|tara:strand:+ start:442 stop:837 length:396 start_codon:yes stop_codon:yes gene_type:complete
MNHLFLINFKKLKLFLFLFLLSITVLAQNEKLQESSQGHDESSGPVYIEVDKNAMGRSPAYKVSTPNYFTVQVNIDENGNNIIGDAGNEPSLAVDPTNPNRIVMGWRQFDDASNYFRQAYKLPKHFFYLYK